MLSVRDRLNEMRLAQNSGANAQNEENNVENAENINKTFQEVELIQQNIELIKTNTLRANSILKNNLLKIPKDLLSEFDELFSSTTSLSYTINNKLKLLHNDLSNLKNTNSTEYRIKKIQFNTLKQSFRQALEESSACLELHKNDRRERLKKEMRIANKNVDDEELEHLLDENKLDIFTDNILALTHEARQQLADLEERHQELLKIEKHLHEVLDLFIKLATLVEQQQDSIDRVEFHAETATEAVLHGAADLGKGVVAKRKATKKKIYILLIIIVILLIIILIVVL